MEARGAPEYWLQIETRATASLAQLDGLLRSTWLECCGHLSVFHVGRVEISKRTRIGGLPTQVRAFDYEYDFGSTTYLTGRVVGGRVGSLGRRRAPARPKRADSSDVFRVRGAGHIDLCAMYLRGGPRLLCEAWSVASVLARRRTSAPRQLAPNRSVRIHRLRWPRAIAAPAYERAKASNAAGVLVGRPEGVGVRRTEADRPRSISA